MIGSSASPSAVAVMPPGWRRISGRPSVASTWAIWRVRCGWASPSDSAAPRIDPARSTVASRNRASNPTPLRGQGSPWMATQAAAIDPVSSTWRRASTVSARPVSVRRVRGRPSSPSIRSSAAATVDNGCPQTRAAARNPPCRNAAAARITVTVRMGTALCSSHGICRRNDPRASA